MGTTIIRVKEMKILIYFQSQTKSKRTGLNHQLPEVFQQDDESYSS